MNPLKTIEQQFNFQYPECYHHLYAGGMLDWGKAGPDRIAAQYPLLCNNPPLLLYANDFELSNFRDIVLQLQEFADPDYWMNIKPGLQFIPFATNGAGDMYCFFPTGQQGKDIPVVLLWHDANRAEYKSGNLQDFIFRYMLEAVADLEEAAYGLLQEDNFKTDLDNFLRTHSPYLSPQQQETISRVYQLPGNNPLIDAVQLAEILKKEMDWDLPDQTFPYQNN